MKSFTTKQSKKLYDSFKIKTEGIPRDIDDTIKPVYEVEPYNEVIPTDRVVGTEATLTLKNKPFVIKKAVFGTNDDQGIADFTLYAVIGGSKTIISLGGSTPYSATTINAVSAFWDRDFGRGIILDSGSVISLSVSTTSTIQFIIYGYYLE